MPDNLTFERPDCPRCGARLMLSRIEPYPIDAPTHERHSFECRGCGHSTFQIVEFKRAPKGTAKASAARSDGERTIDKAGASAGRSSKG